MESTKIDMYLSENVFLSLVTDRLDKIIIEELMAYKCAWREKKS